MALTVGSLFAGIGGIELGLEMTGGFKTKWQVEIDPYAQKVLQLRFPEAKLYEDVKQVGKYNLEKVDLICGGFPCQDISYAGKGAGIEGERSGLWSEFSRIIREIRPRYILVENVSALLNRGMSRVLGDLAESGYDAEWDCLPAAAFGARHLRWRLFLVAYPNQSTNIGFVFPRHFPSANTFKFWNNCPASLNSDFSLCGDNTYSKIRRMVNGIPDWLDRWGCLGNAVVPQIAFWIGQQILRVEHG